MAKRMTKIANVELLSREQVRPYFIQSVLHVVQHIILDYYDLLEDEWIITMLQDCRNAELRILVPGRGPSKYLVISWDPCTKTVAYLDKQYTIQIYIPEPWSSRWSSNPQSYTSPPLHMSFSALRPSNWCHPLQCSAGMICKGSRCRESYATHQLLRELPNVEICEYAMKCAYRDHFTKFRERILQGNTVS